MSSRPISKPAASIVFESSKFGATKMKSLKLVTMLGAMGVCLAASAATTDGGIFQTRAEREAAAAEARSAEIAMDAQRQADFEAALPARLALANSVIDQFRAEFTNDADGMKRLSQFAAQVHSTPSSVLKAARFARNVADFAGQAEKLLAQPSNAKAQLGDSTNLVFYPVGPCRIADSRFSTAGILSNNVTRTYLNYSAPGQGGDGVCNIGPAAGFLSGTPGSIAMNIAATSISGTGNLNVRPVGSTTVTSSLNFQPGQDISNATVIKMTGTGGADFEIRPSVNGPGTIHVIIDLLGFYTTSQPAPLECNTTAFVTASSTTTGFKSLSAPACGAGFTRTAIFCSLSGLSGADMQSSGFAGSDCEWEQTTTANITRQAASRCCRVPGNSTGRF
jgi:hypothetical protein